MRLFFCQSHPIHAHSWIKWMRVNTPDSCLHRRSGQSSRMPVANNNKFNKIHECNLERLLECNTAGRHICQSKTLQYASTDPLFSAALGRFFMDCRLVIIRTEQPRVEAIRFRRLPTLRNPSTLTDAFLNFRSPLL